jgi:hypothetical protein
MNALETTFSDGTKKNLFFLVGLTSVGRYQNDLHRNTDKYDHGENLSFYTTNIGDATG